MGGLFHYKYKSEAQAQMTRWFYKKIHSLKCLLIGRYGTVSLEVHVGFVGVRIIIDRVSRIDGRVIVFVCREKLKAETGIKFGMVLVTESPGVRWIVLLDQVVGKSEGPLLCLEETDGTLKVLLVPEVANGSD